MDFFLKYKLSVWLVVALIILNIATLIFMWVTFASMPKPHSLPPPHGRDRIDIFENMKLELALDEEQTKKFDEFTLNHLDDMKTFGDSIQFYKTQIVNESFSQSADTVKINFLSTKIGYMQSQIERSISNHFINIGKICKSGQIDKIKESIKRIQSKPPRNEPPPPKR